MDSLTCLILRHDKRLEHLIVRSVACECRGNVSVHNLEQNGPVTVFRRLNN